MSTKLNSLYPKKRNPYYIVTPRYVRTSAGIKALHLLCHWLNRLGEEAYVHISPTWDGDVTRYNLLTPLLTERVVAYHKEEKRAPIAIFSETATENVLQARNIVRLFGHLPNHLEQFKKFSDSELSYGYSSFLAKACGNPDNILFIPTIETEIFFPPPSDVTRLGTCFYAAKYQSVHKQKVFGLPSNCFEIKRDTPDQLNQYELAALFKRSEMLYCFEDSAIANEAALCGCPVVLMPNRFFDRPIAIEEVGWDGFAWGDSEVEVQRARNTVELVHAHYKKRLEDFFGQLESFIEKTQTHFSSLPYDDAVVSIETPDEAEKQNTQPGKKIKKHSLARAIAYKTPILSSFLLDRRRLYEENKRLKEKILFYLTNKTQI